MNYVLVNIDYIFFLLCILWIIGVFIYTLKEDNNPLIIAIMMISIYLGMWSGYVRACKEIRLNNIYEQQYSEEKIKGEY